MATGERPVPTLLLRPADAGAPIAVPLATAVAQCGIFTDLGDDLREDADRSDDGTVTVDVPCRSIGVEVVVKVMMARDLLVPVSGEPLWATDEVMQLQRPFMTGLLGAEERLEDGGVDRLMEAMIAADYLRHDFCVALLANYLSSRLARATPTDVKHWCGREGPLTAAEQDDVLRMHRMLMAQRL
jgi:hypothetical protein